MKKVVKAVKRSLRSLFVRGSYQYRVVADSGLFDKEYYLSAFSGKAPKDPLAHYMEHGWRRGISPSAHFSVQHYLNANPDVRSTGHEPLFHYVIYGEKEGRTPNPYFSPEAYVRHHPDLKGFDKSLLLHYQKFGQFEGRRFFEGRLAEESVGPNGDIEQIRSSGFFDERYYLESYPDVRSSGMDPLLHYLAHGHQENRNPSKKFDTEYYRKAYLDGCADVCPLAHMAEQGLKDVVSPRPEHAIDLPESSEVPTPLLGRSALHIHAYYPEVFKELTGMIHALGDAVSLLISVTRPDAVTVIERELKLSRLKNPVDIRIVANTGRDIAPWVVGFSDAWAKFDYICHLHTKKSPHTDFGRRWRSYLFDQLVGSPQVVSAILATMENDGKIGVMYPDNYFEIKKFVGWNGNEQAALNLTAKLGFPNVQAEDLFDDFPAGSMCWVRSEAFECLINKVSLQDFESEDNQLELTLAHVLERCLTVLPHICGYKPIKYYNAIVNPDRYAAEWERDKQQFALPAGQSRWTRDTPFIALNDRVDLNPATSLFNVNSMNIHWIIPDFGLGAGGHMTIFRMVSCLERFGHRQTIWIQNAHNYKTPTKAKEAINKHYQPISDNVIVQFLPEDVNRIAGDAVIATDCWTAFPAMAMSRFKERFYLIQDWEPLFHPAGDANLVAQLTYSFGFKALTAGKWLYDKAQDAGMWARNWDLAVDLECYYPDAKGRQQARGPDEPIRIAFYARPYTPRRVVATGVAALVGLHRREVDFHVIFFGEDDVDFNVDFSHEYRGILDAKELGDLYRQVDLGVVFSATNYSLIPLEMLACGLPLLELETECTTKVLAEYGVELVKPDPLLISSQLEEMAGNIDEHKARASKAAEMCKSLSWEASARSIEGGLREGLQEGGYEALDSAELFSVDSSRYKFKAAVIIPTYNAGAAFEKILQTICGQSCSFDFEVVIVDSGSSDQTLDIIRSCPFPNLQLIEIPNEEFSHGPTRNLAISKTNAEFVAVTTQDALPQDLHWLANLVKTFDAAPDVAGVFGAHLGYPEHSQFVQRDVASVFENFKAFGDVFRWNLAHPDQGGMGWQLMLQFYSDNNSCMRRSVWDKIPYPDVDWGEDQIWAWNIIQLGLSKGYAKDAVVYHSHDDTPEKRFDTARHEGRLFMEHFGISLIDRSDDIDLLVNQAVKREEDYGMHNNISESEILMQKEVVEASVRGRFDGGMMND
jgi:glycosyltransferase involved in cell wall biosynthesis